MPESEYVSPEYVETVTRTWAEWLAQYGKLRDLAAIAVDCELAIAPPQYNYESESTDIHVDIHVPILGYGYVMRDESARELLTSAIVKILAGRVVPVTHHDEDRGFYTGTRVRVTGSVNVAFLPRLLPDEDGWQERVRALITTSKGANNQGRVTSIVFQRDGREVLTYNEMLFATQAEVRVALELEKRGIMFLPLPLVVKNETGIPWKDRREPDFLICVDGIWGVMEISGSAHEGRYEKDAEKSVWFKLAGILCVEYYTTERAFAEPAAVVDEFLSILKRHKR